MKHLTFIRCSTAFHCWDYYEQKTEVWVLGDVAGFRYFARKLAAATTSRGSVHLDVYDPHFAGMCVLVLPAARTDMRRPRLKLIERFVRYRGQPKMELVIHGNQKGYELIANLLLKLCESTQGSPADHVHLDDHSCKYLVKRSVSLNIRAPLLNWSRKNLLEYVDLVYPKQPNASLPADLAHPAQAPKQYERISAEHSDFLTL